VSLPEGTRLGAYEITGKIGAGGMGEVYRATDTKLGRDVAIKTLPASLADDPGRLARFEREAKLLAALNHPHIGAIYGLDEHDGTLYIAMELVEGETLEDKLKADALPVEDSLRIALQIAQALEAAHDKGVVHRDLKPANVMINRDGLVKVLDFGLAKAFTTDSDGASPDNSPALSVAMTQAGLVLGTAGYMSPEQASGQATDQRADIWAFGVVLYEMLTGLPLFSGESVPHILAEVLKTQPDWGRLPQNLHPRLRLTLERCLEKKPRNRYHSIADARVDIEQALSDPRGVTPTPVGTSGAPFWRRALPVAAALVIGVALGGASLWNVEPEPLPPVAAQRLSVMTPADRRVAISGFPTGALTLSPDGRQLAYVTRDRAALEDPSRASRIRLALRTLDSLAVRDLPGTVDARQPFFSPDGTWLGFFTGTGELRKISLAGGAPITLAENINASQWTFGVWIPDGTIVFGSLARAGLRRVSAEGGAVEDVTTLEADETAWHNYPAWVPESGAVLFTTLTAGTPRIDAVMLESGERHPVLDNARYPHVLDSGHLLFQRDDAVLVAPFDARGLTVTGPAVPLIDEVQHDQAGLISVAQLAVSRNGTLAYLPAVATANTLGFVGRDGAFEALGLPPGDYSLPRMSRDGRSLAFLDRRDQASDVWLYDIERGTTSKLGAAGRDLGLAWHPDGRSLAVATFVEAGFEIVLRNLDGTEQLLVPPVPGADLMRNLAWSPDGMHLAVTVQTGSLHDVWIYSVVDAEAAPFLAGAASEYSPSFSPDGSWIAYEYNESGQSQVYVQAYPEGQRFQVSIDGGGGPVWAPDGTELSYQGRVGNEVGLVTVSVTAEGDGLSFGRPAMLYSYTTSDSADGFQYAGSNNVGTGFDVAPDGERFAAIRINNSGLGREIVLVQNWFEEVERRAPTE
jgi:serine/threonine-protein kinase